MTNSKLLCEAIKRSGFKREYIAERLGITRACLKLKIDGKNEFLQSEIYCLTQLLSLSKKEREQIFLQNKFPFRKLKKRGETNAKSRIDKTN